MSLMSSQNAGIQAQLYRSQMAAATKNSLFIDLGNNSS